MSFRKYLLASAVAFLPVCFVCGTSSAQQKKADYTKYYVSNSGDDNSPGTIEAPFRTIQKINSLKLKPGTVVYLKGGNTFKGPLTIIGTQLPANRDIDVTSYGKGKAVISADSVRAISIYHANNVRLMDLKLIGLGRKTGSRENGLAIISSKEILIDDLDISGFQKSGLLIDSSSNVHVSDVLAHDNGSAGFTVEGRTSKKDSRHIDFYHCRAENNPGDPTKLDNHSGNGIVVAHCTDVTIRSCAATNNGWDMPRIGNGPVGIWCYEADSVKISDCLSYNNKTSKGGADGGGFDLDGGTTNSSIQYCNSYGNQGSGYCIFQYWGASPWHDNVICNNISFDDGTVSDSQAGMYVWNSSDDPKQFYNCKVYNNIVYNDKVAALSFSDKSENDGFDFYHNIFVGKDSLIKGRDKLGKCRFTGNNWWSLTSGFNAWGVRDFKEWAVKFGQEQKDGKIEGFSINPAFKNVDISNVKSYDRATVFHGYKFSSKSALKKLFGGNLPQTTRILFY